jgi:hypothetical protein
LFPVYVNINVVYFHVSTLAPWFMNFSGDGKEWKLLGQEQDGSLLVSWLIESFDEDGVLKLQSFIGLFHKKDDVLKVCK